MPFSITEDADYLTASFSGIVTAGDVLGLAAAAWGIEKSRELIPHRITDLSGVENMDVDFTVILRAAENRKNKTFANPFKSAFVAPRDHQLGFVRMFQTLNDHPQIEIRIFRDRPSAEAWLAEK
jgi:hypothetical protein